MFTKEELKTLRGLVVTAKYNYLQVAFTTESEKTQKTYNDRVDKLDLLDDKIGKILKKLETGEILKELEGECIKND